ncbi:MAG: 3'(2'),5'-bisphosphate nucleotidase CysQ [Thioalkalivibrionaceae bacterium]
MRSPAAPTVPSRAGTAPSSRSVTPVTRDAITRPNHLRHLWPQLQSAASHAAEAIRNVYATRFDIDYKADESPITAADRAAHDILGAHLSALPEPWCHLPVLSEEGHQPGFNSRKNWAAYWLLDPLDGTREFIARSDEFTVNIALIVGAEPVLGLVHLPIGDMGWRGGPDGAFRYRVLAPDATSQRTEKSADARRFDEVAIHVDSHQPPIVCVSRRHGLATTDALLASLGTYTRIRAGSSLKFCRVAEGAADLYLRTSSTSEWDTAAGQAVVEAAGGSVTDLAGRRLQYNQRETLRNPHFIASNGPPGAWTRRLRPHPDDDHH